MSSRPAVAVAGTGITPHGFDPYRSWKDLVVASATAALDEAGVDPGQIDGGYVSVTLPETFEQQNLGVIAADELGLPPGPFGQIVGACAGGLMAIQAGVRMIQSGAHERVLIAGIEKLSDTTATPDSMLTFPDAEFESPAGFDYVDTMALMHQRYMDLYGATPEQIAQFVVQDRWYASRNPAAIDRGRPPLTVEDVLAADWVSAPITRPACGRACDGSSAVVLTRADLAPAGSPLIAGIAQATAPNALATKYDRVGYAGEGDIAAAAVTARAAERAFADAGITPADVDVAQVHDCFSVMGILHLEGLGIFARGEGARAVAEGATALDGTCPTNTDGGRIGLGHPTGTTGINVTVESVRQLRGDAGERQVDDPAVAVCQSMGGNNSNSSVAVLRRAA